MSLKLLISVQLSSEGPRKFALREKRDPKQITHCTKLPSRKPAWVRFQLWIDWVEWEGPFNSPTTGSPLQEILAKHAVNSEREQATASENLEDARAIFTEFARKRFEMCCQKPNSLTSFSRCIKRVSGGRHI